jgi:DNA polymerase-3 subunit delta'
MTLAPWHLEPWQQLIARVRSACVPHALLLAGPGGLGKEDFADAFARSLLCTARGDDGAACGTCVLRSRPSSAAGAWRRLRRPMK